MLLALDVGNTNTVLGLYRLASQAEGAGNSASANAVPEMVANWRVTTHITQTADEYGVLFLNLFAMQKIEVKAVEAIIISSVVPPIESTLRRVCERYFNIKPMFIEPGIKTGMPILVDHPGELGADRLVNSVAAFAKYGGPVIVVDFGTATTFDVVSAQGEYIGGVIAPGAGISADALFARAAKLSRVDIKKPAKVIGTNTIGHMQSGLYYGYIGLVDGIIERIIEEMPAPAGRRLQVIATGGLARQIVDDSKYLKQVDDMLTLDGLQLIFERNRLQKSRETARKHA
jgi:type III pantothenate kinase